MCVICVKPKGVQMPPKEIINAMFRANHDGCGFCTPTHSYKGLSIASFLQELKKVGEDQPCIMHFRWATHGSVKRSNCHPFYDGATDTWFAHNGVLNIMPTGDRTDSETAFRCIIAPDIERYGLDADETKSDIEQIRETSRFAIMQGSELRLYGQYFERFGCFYSNLNFVHLMYSDRIYKNNLGVTRKGI